jgi:hypothetical protein
VGLSRTGAREPPRGLRFRLLSSSTVLIGPGPAEVEHVAGAVLIIAGALSLAGGALLGAIPDYAGSGGSSGCSGECFDFDIDMSWVARLIAVGVGLVVAIPLVIGGAVLLGTEGEPRIEVRPLGSLR